MRIPTSPIGNTSHINCVHSITEATHRFCVEIKNASSMCTIRNGLSKAVIGQVKKLDMTTVTKHSLRLRQNLTQAENWFADSLKDKPAFSPYSTSIFIYFPSCFIFN